MNRTLPTTLIFWCCGLLLWVTTANAQIPNGTLPLGQSIERELARGETHTYDFALPADFFLRLQLESRGGELVVQVLNAGAPLAESHQGNAVRFIAPRAGVYRLQIAMRDGAAGRYVIALKERRAATAQDRQPAAAAAADPAILEPLLKEANQLRADYSQAGMRQSIEKFQQALTLWREQRGAARQEGELLREIADTYATLFERYRTAADRTHTLNFYQQARDAVGADDHAWQAQLFYELGVAHGNWRELPEALEYYRQALVLYEAVGNEAAIANTLQAQGEVRVVLGQHEQGIALYRQALPHWRAAQHQRGEASTLNSIALAYNRMGDNQQALATYQQALALKREAQDEAGALTVLNNIALVYAALGELQQAVDTLVQVKDASRARNDEESVAFAALNLGAASEQLGQLPQAQAYFNEALPIFQKLNYRVQLAQTRNNLAKVLDQLNDKAQAREQFQQALALMRAANDKLGVLSIQLNLAKLTAEAGDRTQAQTLLEDVLTQAQAANARGLQLSALNQLGRLQLDQGAAQQALDFHRQALPLALATSNPRAEAATRAGIARAADALGDLNEARTQIEAALVLIENLRTRLAAQELRTSYFASVQSYFEYYIDLLMRMRRQDEGGQHAATALHVNERARARGLLDLLTEARADIREGADAALLARERTVQLQLNRKVEEQIRLLGGPHTPAQAQTVARALEKLQATYQDIQTQLRQRSPRYAALTQPQPLTLAEIQAQVLDEDSLLLEYTLGRERSYLWAVTKDSLQSYELPKREVIEAAARRWLNALTARNEAPPQESAARKGRRLARADAQAASAGLALRRLVLPRALRLTQARLLIVGDGVLQYVPFPALPDSVARGSQPLLVKHEIIALPSASTLAVLRRERTTPVPAKGVVAVVADPVFEAQDERLARAATAPAGHSASTDATRSLKHEFGALRLARLPYTAQEADRILQFAPAERGFKALGFQATRAMATSAELRQYKYVHFATHGYFNSAQPALSGLVFSRFDERGQPQNGFLLSSDIFNLQLPAEAVVLSACETGLGEEVRGEGLVGLTRGFMYAGAARVVVSLWSINDRATADLMANFYRTLLQPERTTTPAAALRAAQLALWRNPRWRAPYYWAAFMLQGEYR